MRNVSLHWLIWALLAAILVSGLGILCYAWFQVSSGYLHGDALIFQTVGRGMLHGARPYVDLFETKPPGVFLLHALSWKLFGSQFFVSLVLAVLLVSLPIRILLPSLDIIVDRPGSDRKILSLLTLLFGTTITLYIINQAGGGLAESFGAYFGVLFLSMLITHRPSVGRSLFLGGLLLLAVGFKEPFLLSITAGAILLSGFQVFKFSILPACLVAAVLGLIGLLAFGLFDPFFQVYLPHMLGFHVHQHDGSTLVHALGVWRVFINLGAYSWGFALAITLLWLLVARTALLRWLLATYLTLLAVAIGGDFYGHHFVFAVPFYCVLWWKFLALKHQKFVVPVLSALLIVTALSATKLSYAGDAVSWNKHEAEMKQAAATIDEVMDNCNWEKYLQIIPRVGDAFAYTDHVPYGPIFLHYSRFIGAKREYQTAFIRALNEAQIALVLDLKTSNLSEDAIEFMGVHFSDEAPACAGAEFSQPEPYTLLFRRD